MSRRVEVWAPDPVTGRWKVESFGRARSEVLHGVGIAVVIAAWLLGVVMLGALAPATSGVW